MPNPNSALNADAGHLLREDYDSFCRQARLMTSIHASIPSHLKEAALMAKRRGEEPGATALEVEEVKPRMKNKSISSSVVMKKKIPQRIMSTQSEPVPCSKSTVDEDSSNEEDEASESKENDPTLSPVPVPEQSPRKPALSKRPLSDLPIPTEVGREDAGSFCASSSQQNVMNNKAASSSGARSANSCKTVPPNEQAYGIRYAGRSLQDSGGNALITGSFEDHTHDYNARPAKRVCSEESMQNLSEMHTLDPLPEQPLLVSSGSSKSSLAAPRKASTTSSIGAGTVKGSLRVGLRRL
ncbi:hypothetical protein MMC21_001416 [Puttea exsequens]|nr:hypothetical protein [Puttea exsequens]